MRQPKAKQVDNRRRNIYAPDPQLWAAFEVAARRRRSTVSAEIARMMRDDLKADPKAPKAFRAALPSPEAEVKP